MLTVPLEASLFNIYENKLISKLLAASTLRFLIIIGLVYFMIRKGFSQFNGLYPSFTITNLSLFFIAVAVILVLSYSSYEIYLETQIHKLVLFGISQAFVGILEELLFRGIVFPLFIIHYAGKKRPVFKALCLSSLLFGLVHLVGLIRHPENIWGVTYTVIYAIGIGFLLACLFLRTRNILVPAFIHFLIDFTNAAYDLKEEVVARSEPSQSTILLTLAVVIAIALFCFGAGMFLFKRVQPEEWLQKASLIKI
ncbi:abortive infection protein [Flammeovirgaceae bacterium 311]|nr:abortive infection protein [Flammeovirgaceae bacterium 311]